MKRILLIVIAAVLACQADGQQLPRRTQFALNPYLINPAVAGTKLYTPIMVTYRNQWAGFTSAPTTATLSAHTSLPNRVGIGGIFFTDNTGGAIQRTGVELTGSYHVDLNNQDAVSFGLSGILGQYTFDNEVLEVWDQGDQALQGGMESTLMLDANFGMMVYGQNYSFGFAFPNLVQTKLNLDSDVAPDDNRNARHYYFMANYEYPINEALTLSPKGLIKFTGASPVQFDMHLQVAFQDVVWGGLTYRHKDAIAFGFGANLAGVVVGYSYDLTVTDARNFSPHTHELTVGYRIYSQRGVFRSGSLGPRILDRKRVID
ncbi:MAG: type IX secretion system membrane protein PorP/SprF [Flavobacteriales bacterium]